MNEQRYQKQIMDKLRSDGWYVIKLIKTNVNGIPDIVAFKKGQEPIFIEVKAKGGVTSKLQDFRIKELREKYGMNVEVWTMNE